MTFEIKDGKAGGQGQMDAEKSAMKKRKQNAGFTLAETLIAVLILLMVSAIVATGIPVARNAYEKVVLTSNAEVLLSTTISTLRSELGTAKEIQVGDDGKTITFYKEYREDETFDYLAYSSQISIGEYTLKSDSGKKVNTILYQRYTEDSGLMLTDAERSTLQSALSTPLPLVSQEAATGDLYVTYDSAALDDGILTFSGLRVQRAGKTDPLTGPRSLSIRMVLAAEEET